MILSYGSVLLLALDNCTAYAVSGNTSKQAPGQGIDPLLVKQVFEHQCLCINSQTIVLIQNDDNQEPTCSQRQPRVLDHGPISPKHERI